MAPVTTVCFSAGGRTAVLWYAVVDEDAIRAPPPAAVASASRDFVTKVTLPFPGLVYIRRSDPGQGQLCCLSFTKRFLIAFLTLTEKLHVQL